MKVGEYLIVNKRSVVNENTGVANLVAAKEVRQRVVAVYRHGAVRTETGDVWMPFQTRKGMVGGW